MVEAFEASTSHKLVYTKELHDIEIPMVQRKIEELRQELADEGVFESEHTEIDEAVKRLDTIGDSVKKAKERGH